MKLLFLLASLATLAVAKVDYSHWQLFNIEIQNDEDKLMLETLKDNSHFIFWKNIHADDMSADILVHPESIEALQYLFRMSKVTLKISDLQTELENETPAITSRSNKMSWDRYHTHKEISKWLDELAEEFKDNVTVIRVGKSHEKRSIKGVRVRFNRQNSKKVIYLEAGIHGREWITVATLTYVLNELLRSTDPEVRQMADSYDWYIFPVVNPDGYVYSMTTDRMWRKSRKPSGRGCFGVDLNRNWNHTSIQPNESPCSDAYPGKKAFSEPETKGLNGFYKKFASRFVGYVSFHSYSQLLLIPYGDSTDKRDNFDKLYEAAGQMVTAIKEKNNNDYTYGNLKTILYSALGTNVDFVKRTYKTRITYFWELMDRGQHGFLIPASDIVTSGEETKTGLIAMTKYFNSSN